MRVPWALALAILIAGCSGAPPVGDDGEAPPPPSDGKGVLRGVVVDEVVRPVADATVRLHTGQQVRSGSDGSFRWTGLDPGEYFLTATKVGYASAQTSARVEPGVATPASIRMQLVYLPDEQPRMETLVLHGFYECAMTSDVVTDSCDWVYRTGHDVVSNETGEDPLVPRSVQRFHNTMAIDVDPRVRAVVQEGFWSDGQVSSMKISLDATPIDPACDCSHSFLEVEGASPTYGRLDGEQVPTGQTVAARGFLPFGDPQVATNFEFTVYTTLFYNVRPPEGWSFVAGDPQPF